MPGNLRLAGVMVGGARQHEQEVRKAVQVRDDVHADRFVGGEGAETPSFGPFTAQSGT